MQHLHISFFPDAKLVSESEDGDIKVYHHPDFHRWEDPAPPIPGWGNQEESVYAGFTETVWTWRGWVVTAANTNFAATKAYREVADLLLSL